ncbi:uncharacterized protein LOC8285602 [Ricinus communis]|uniref:Maternal effect embryo arrest 59 n=1 Tax=Ricinus communis TaxID=3988 RepID=B9SG17_RICCO|nr:uncharacterized protein LOC8285602 [Ricinus communis]EEF37433.1 conserved hypothetical protein [Ricinus communis]|eukprot:XP_002524936.1 uncharacterized protein LOC8285602 [Ricinus communis]
MVGQWTVTKPSRSDEVLDANQQLEVANQIRAQFDSIAPKRPVKPSRSESDAAAAPCVAEQNSIPELDKLQSLQSQPTILISAEGANIEQDEFVETQYYKELDSIDKQHHTTGSGFIKVTKEENINGYNIQFPRGHGAGTLVSGCRSNPATNDWIPNSEDDQAFVSSKPNRSESS